MNKTDRRTLTTAMASIKEIQESLATLRGVVSAIRDEDQSKYDDMSDARRDGDAGERLFSDVSALEEALEAIDAVDLKEVAEKIAAAADADVPEVSEAALTARQVELRRWKRLAPWAQKTITTLRGELKASEDKASNMFAEETGKRGELAIHDYGKLHGRILPTTTIMVPELKIQISVDKHGRGLMIRGDMSIMVLPDASNTVRILPVEGF